MAFTVIDDSVKSDDLSDIPKRNLLRALKTGFL